MPYISGGDLYSLLEFTRVFNEDTIKFFITQVIMGIGRLHEHGIMHRDLKLENLMLGINGYIKIIDFGLAKKLNPQDVANTVCGTPFYYAPELIQIQSYDKSVDWWAIGILMFEMLTGKVAFFSENRRELYANIVN